jgi:hypothetical protein
MECTHEVEVSVTVGEAVCEACGAVSDQVEDDCHSDGSRYVRITWPDGDVSEVEV